MKNAKDGSSSKPDRRKYNLPPVHGQIQPGEIRNKYGRAGKPRLQPPTSIDALILSEASRTVSYDEHGPVDAKRRLVQQLLMAALANGNVKVAEYLLSRLHEADARVGQMRDELLTFVLKRKAELTDEFFFAREARLTPPGIVPHPDHVVIANGAVHFTGPTDRRGRKVWEETKAAIRVAAALHDIIRAEYRRSGSAEVLAELKAIEKHRRMLMRSVPKGWNWQEDIYCRNSMSATVTKIIKKLYEVGYVAP